MDVVVDYLGVQYIIELKIWHGEEYNRKGEEQLCDYLEKHNLKKGYLVSFCFNKNKESGVNVTQNGDKTIVEAVVWFGLQNSPEYIFQSYTQIA